MTVRMTRLEGMKSKAEYDGLGVISGRVDRESKPEGMSPGRLMTAALGLCVAMHIASYLKRHGVEAEDLSLTVKTRSERNPSRAVEFNIEVNLKADLDEKQRAALIAKMGRCYVTNTLKAVPKINISLKTL
ncbi:hypothetical protein CW700_02210 [Candidatus Bathyarchaeota archaeon]|nr:MAG: hypothetical protein CW700_02210 [Candidatus Bathyarchaeota archaeon]